jgi:acetyl esterase/lipase
MFRALHRAVPALGLLLAACSPLSAFDALVPKDGGARQVAKGLAYGEGPRQRLDIYVPTGAQAGPRPVIVFFYGGSWNSGSRSGYAFVGRALAARGFVTVIPDYRLVPEVVYPGFVLDGASAVRWVRAHAKDYGGDGDRIVLAGHSAGAYIAAMLAVDDRWLGADRGAVRGLVGLAGPYDFAPFTVGASIQAFGDWRNPAETQPVTWAGAGDPPALLLAGAEDTIVRPRNSEKFAAALR